MSIRKKLGQNFLNSKSIAKFIVHSAQISKNDTVYEIGIGKTYLKVIINEINKKKFDNYDDIESRAGIKDPVNHLSQRIIEEISGETQFRLFVKK